MMQRIHIGLLAGNPGWEKILSQIGVSWSRMNVASAKNPDRFSCIIANRSVDDEERNILETYIKSGRSLIDPTGQFLPVSPVQRRIKSVSPLRNSIFSHISGFNIECKCLVHPESELFVGTIWFDPSPKRAVVFSGLPVHKLTEISPMVSGMFRSSELPAIQERTARYCSHNFMEIILSMMKFLHKKSNLPFVHKWWMPDHDRLAATFRIDSDYGTKDAVRKVFKAADTHSVPLSWFLHVSAHESWLNYFSTAAGHEMAVHCYDHTEYKTTSQYFADITRALNQLRAADIHPRGYAAPYGVWNPQLAEALTRFSFKYSSEFGYDFDSLPSTPGQSHTLQLPIHPISAGSFSRFRFTEDMIRKYFDEIINLKTLQKSPVHLYHHPNDSDADFLNHIFSNLNSKSVHWMTYSEWADWWEKRNSNSFSPRYDEESQKLITTSQNSLPVAVHIDDNRFLLTFCKEINLAESRFNAYIEPELVHLAEKRNNSPVMSSFKQLKDSVMTSIWRNRA